MNDPKPVPVTAEEAAVRTLAATRLTADAIDALGMAARSLDQWGLTLWKEDTVVTVLDDMLTDLSGALAGHGIHLPDGTKETDAVERLHEASIRVRHIALLLDEAEEKLSGISAGMDEQYKDDVDEDPDPGFVPAAAPEDPPASPADPWAPESPFAAAEEGSE